MNDDNSKQHKIHFPPRDRKNKQIKQDNLSQKYMKMLKEQIKKSNSNK